MEKTLHFVEPVSTAWTRRKLRYIYGCVLFTLLVAALAPGLNAYNAYRERRLSPHAAAALSRCRSLSLAPGPSPDFHKRKQSDRYVPGTKPTLLKNARIWTGAENGTEVIHADVLLDKGLIKGVGHVSRATLNSYRDDLVVIDVKNAWVTPGYVVTGLTLSV